MKHFLNILLFFCITALHAQPKLELTPQGFQEIELPTPNVPLDQLIELSKSWAASYNKVGYDVFEVTQSSMTIEAKNENAYYYYNVGVKYNFDIKYSLRIAFREDKKYTLKLVVKELYGENVLLKTTVADFFTPEGTLKEDFGDAKRSLENTVNAIIKSYANFISR